MISQALWLILLLMLAPAWSDAADTPPPDPAGEEPVKARQADIDLAQQLFKLAAGRDAAVRHLAMDDPQS